MPRKRFYWQNWIAHCCRCVILIRMTQCDKLRRQSHFTFSAHNTTQIIVQVPQKMWLTLSRECIWHNCLSQEFPVPNCSFVWVPTLPIPRIFHSEVLVHSCLSKHILSVNDFPPFQKILCFARIFCQSYCFKFSNLNV